jgi:pSer/pThr/pTyr-binding forkhead associated (FHA) protein
MRVTLEIVSGPHSGRKLAVRSGYVVQVGRTEWADFVLPEDGQLSGVHFSVECSAGECRIRDLNSSNGTRVNGKRVSETAVGEGDQIEAGQTRFVVHLEDAAAPLPSRPSDPTATVRVRREEERGRESFSASAETASPTEETDRRRGERLPTPLPQPEPDRQPLREQTPMRVVLEMLEGPSETQKVALLPGQVVHVGRTDRADLVFPGDGQMSSRHFSVAYQGGACRLRDLNSTNGTLVNGNRLTEAVLADGDRIQAGQTVFVLRIEGGGQQAAVSSPTPAACFRAGIEDEDPDVRREALLAAVWTRQPWLLEHCRKAAAHPSPEHWDAILLLAILGKPQDLPRILAVGRTEELGPRRFEVLGAYGHPAVVDLLVAAIAADDAESAAAAATAYQKITGADLVDPEQVRGHWRQFKPTIWQWNRCCRGFNVSQGASEETLAELDMLSRWEAICRQQYEGVRSRSLIDLEALTGFA